VHKLRIFDGILTSLVHRAGELTTGANRLLARFVQNGASAHARSGATMHCRPLPWPNGPPAMTANEPGQDVDPVSAMPRPELREVEIADAGVVRLRSARIATLSTRAPKGESESERKLEA
jgi:hypothetical protein